MLAVLEALVEGAELDDLELHVDADRGQVGLEHGRHVPRLELSRSAGGYKQAELDPVWITGLGKELSGPVGVVGPPRNVVVGPDVRPRRNRAVGDVGDRVEDVGDELLLVDGRGHGLADQRVLERREAFLALVGPDCGEVPRLRKSTLMLASASASRMVAAFSSVAR